MDWTFLDGLVGLDWLGFFGLSEIFVIGLDFWIGLDFGD